MTQRERIAQLEAELAELRARLARLEPTPGLPGLETWAVAVGGISVHIRALTPAQWAMALHDLPEFLFAYAAAQARGEQLGQDVLERVVSMARQWILACAQNPGDVAIDRLTIPEALEALKIISRLNGVDAALGEMLQKKLQPSMPWTKPPGATA